MHIVTFYSFKGGVGRSMAMMNTAAALVEDGQSVLVVDFDLEAPGLETFNLPQPEGEKPGIVEFVSEFSCSNISPPVKDYVYKISLKKNTGGELWIMPAGSRDKTYAQRLNAISWRKLYEEQDGYLLFEDLKQQWKAHLDPDYVLIDSRTGHTDVGGICTRQLPDAVVCLFFPTEQNLLGLAPIVERIREEKEKGRRIRLHFVASNVPDLDDENSILEDRLCSFRQQLGYQKAAATIHHYPSLALVNQDIFVLNRPKSRLAAEYRELVEEIRQVNPEDRKGALAFLKTVRKAVIESQPIDDSVGSVEERIDNILSIHDKDPEVLKAAALLREHQERPEEEKDLLSRALKIAPSDPELFAHLAEQPEPDDLVAAKKHAAGAFEGLTSFDILAAVRSLVLDTPADLSGISSWSSMQKLQPDEMILVSQLLSFNRNLLNEAERLIRDAYLGAEDDPFPFAHERRLRTLAPNLIGQRRFSDAVEILYGRDSSDAGDAGIEVIFGDQTLRFDDAMASWGRAGKLPEGDFKSVLDASPGDMKDSVGYMQFMSLAYWAVGDKEKARTYLERARQQLYFGSGVGFSYWSYLYVHPQSFQKDLNEQASMIDGQDILPKVLRRDW